MVLAAVLPFAVEHQKTILYLTRTHSQTNRVESEVRKRMLLYLRMTEEKQPTIFCDTTIAGEYLGLLQGTPVQRSPCSQYIKRLSLILLLFLYLG
jgi:hypothetical protein